MLLLLLILHSQLSLALLHTHRPRFNFSNSTATPLQPYLFSSVSNPTCNDYWLSPRSLNCECFDPTDTCCVHLPNGTPFCIQDGQQCCASTSCSLGQTCCTGAVTGNQGCCPPQTTCSIDDNKNEGCCPVGHICSGQPVCYNYLDKQCLDGTVEGRLCCPAEAPHCLSNVPGYGTGCFGNDTSYLMTINATESGSPLLSSPAPISRTLTSTSSVANDSVGSLTSSSIAPAADSSQTFQAPTLPITGSKSSKTSTTVTTTDQNAPNLCWNSNIQALGTCSTGQATYVGKSIAARNTIWAAQTSILYLMLLFTAFH